MERDQGPVRALTAEECWEFLAASSLGRIATHAGDVLDIFPVNFYADGSSILFRTAPGSKLLELTINERVTFEVDGYDDEVGWSIVVKGAARALERQSEIETADALPLHSWIPTVKAVFVRITPARVSGVHFRRQPEPDPEPY